jgi:hypothetical protein
LMLFLCKGSHAASPILGTVGDMGNKSVGRHG